MKLYCIRHGQAEPGLVDHARHLTAIGRKEITHMAKLLQLMGVKAPTILHSPKNRTQETAQIFAKTLGAKPEVLELLAGGYDDMLSVAHHCQSFNAQHTLLVGHLPTIVQLVSTLTSGVDMDTPHINCTPGTIMVLKKDHHFGWLLEGVYTPSVMMKLDLAALRVA